ncbi:putative transposase YbfD/YdcC [Desulfitobacterium sp. LBE]|uniref:ISAs1 family transposase n=1 Tax=Desulfitobacterium sp. LBE TaxID=884086 RepID=UPI00119B5BB9|nr:ISAs1 family transposase [Desulfitobacterium sp. LBE]TWH58019.1 putative transposase YbfD/YdcC [Desulfitobacterium sp. LBE]TWH60004.1 putative transposase YbfD/YdcC [Desulfitobacterium sp. LBE]
MKELFKRIEQINDPRQAHKTKHKLMDIVVIVLFGMLGNADTWEEIQIFAVSHEELLRNYLDIPHGIPSHDTLQRVMGLITPETMGGIQAAWNDMLSRGEGEKLKKIINIDGKTMRGSRVNETRALHVVSAWSKDDGVCFGQKTIQEKENEILAIPELLKTLSLKNSVITIDAMGTQTKIAEQIVNQKADYVLAVKENQANLYKDIALYFEEEEFKKGSGHTRTLEKARSQMEKRDYYQSEDVSWLADKERWKGLKSIGMVVKTIEKQGKVTEEKRYYISSLPVQPELFAKAVRGHWAIESMHWQLDVTFREDNNTTLDKNAALNLNILRKMCLPILKLLDIGMRASLKSKRYAFCSNPAKYMGQILSM